MASYYYLVEKNLYTLYFNVNKKRVCSRVGITFIFRNKCRLRIPGGLLQSLQELREFGTVYKTIHFYIATWIFVKHADATHSEPNNSSNEVTFTCQQKAGTTAASGSQIYKCSSKSKHSNTNVWNRSIWSNIQI